MHPLASGNGLQWHVTPKQAVERVQGTSILSQLRQMVEGGGGSSSSSRGSEPSDDVAGQAAEDEEGGAAIDADVAEHALLTCAQHLGARFDARLGGFGGAPKWVRGLSGWLSWLAAYK
jgi:hypothetical protein